MAHMAIGRRPQFLAGSWQGALPLTLLHRILVSFHDMAAGTSRASDPREKASHNVFFGLGRFLLSSPLYSFAHTDPPDTMQRGCHTPRTYSCPYIPQIIKWPVVQAKILEVSSDSPLSDPLC